MEKYIATLVLYGIGDIISYLNGKWKTNYNLPNDIRRRRIIHHNIDLISELISDFIYLGGITQFSLKDYGISSRTYYLVMVGNSLINDGQSDDIAEKIKESILMGFNKQIKKTYKQYNLDIDDEYKILDNIDRSDTIKNTNGVATRNLCIGLYYNGKKNRTKLIDVAINSGRATHKSSIAYLSGLTTALFTAFAIENIPLNKWVFKMIKILESEYVKKYINNNKDDLYDYLIYIKYWKKYIETRFKNKEIIELGIFYNLQSRVNYFNEHFIINKNEYIGETGLSAVIIAYDSLITCKNSFEKLIYYSILHIGDNNATGVIACGLYGAFYGFSNVPKYLVEDSSFQKEVDTYSLYYIGEKIYENNI